MAKKKKRGITPEEAKRLEEEMRDGPRITSKTSITHYRTAKFALNKEDN